MTLFFIGMGIGLMFGLVWQDIADMFNEGRGEDDPRKPW